MVKSYCVKQKKQTECVSGSEKYMQTKNGRLMMKCKCAECGITKTRFVKAQEGGNLFDSILKLSIKGLPKKKRDEIRRADKRLFGGGVMDTVGDMAAEAFIEHGIPWLAKQCVKQGRYFASEFLREPKYQKKIANKAKPIARKAVDYTIDALSGDLLNKASNKLRPKDMIPGNKVKGGRIDYSDWYPMDMYAGDRVNDPTNPLYKKKKGGALARRRGPSTTDKVAWVASNFVTPAPSFGAFGRLLAGQAFKGVKDNVDYYRKGKGVDIHKAIVKVAPKKGFVMPGHKYTGPGNPLEKQLKWDPKTGKILEIYEQPTGKTDAVSMQHDVDYSVCANKPSKDQVKCNNEADRKMVKLLDAIPWKERQWGHAVARNAISSKAKLGLGVKKKEKKESQKTRKAVE